MAKNLVATVHAVPNLPSGASPTSTNPVILSSGDPRVSPGVQAPRGSLCMGTDGFLYVKAGASPTAWAQLSFTPTLTLPSAAWFGHGKDGAQTFSGGTVPGATLPLGSTVYSLTRDIFLGDGSVIASGYTVATNGFRLFCAGTLTNNGRISDDGVNGGTPTGGSGGHSGSEFYATKVPGGDGFGANAGGGGNGHTGSGSPATIGPPHWTTANNGGMGGSGGTIDISHVGGSGGALAASGYPGLTIFGALLGDADNGLAPAAAYSLASGGGGGAVAAGGVIGTDLGGGGGEGGGWCFVAARKLAGTGTITANGGNGGAAQSVTVAAGGGGGGGGGILYLIYETNSIPNPTTSFASNGGSAGTGNSGTAATAGNPGSVFRLNLSGDGT